MKNPLYSWLFAVLLFAAALFYAGCFLIEVEEDDSEGITETIFTNPEDGQIIELDSAGRKVIYLGEKDSDGMPVSITQAIVDGEDMTEEGRTLINFDEFGRAVSLYSEANGMMTLEYVSDTQVVIVFTLPETFESYQLTFNPDNPKKMGDCGCAGSGQDEGKIYRMRNPAKTGAFNPQIDQNRMSPYRLKNTPDLRGNIYTFFNQTGNPVTGNNLLGMYETEEGKTGALRIESGDNPGQFFYYFPSNPAPPPPEGYGDKALSLLNKVCLGAIPVSLAKHQICLRLVNPLAILKCEAVLTAYVWLCRINTGRRIGSYAYDVYTSENVMMTVTSMHPSLPVKRAQANAKPSQGYLPEINIVYDPFAVIGSLYTSPSDPSPDQGYTIYCKVLNGISGVDQVLLSMYGSDGYSQSETFTITESMTCSMSIPGAEQGVKDEITAEVISGNPQPGQTKTIYIIF